ncbi:serine/threonine protein kinase [Rubritalea sp.]|uniref:serine/threonine protein kinase n=1 Tax=Rubritalea sp. TaxID=2109375 RepID=UPI003EF11C01
MDEERYEFTRIIGKGRTGGVYEATDHQLQRKVAVRRFFCAKGDTSTRGWESTFTALTHNLCSLQHPSLLGVLEAGVDEDGAYLIYQLIDGVTLAKQIDQGPLEEAHVYDMAEQLLDALQVAHSNGFVHGAMSTGSVTLIKRPRGGYRAIINDLGLSRLAPLIQGIDSAYARMADPVIMPPEMFDDKEPTSKSDLYMVGHLIYLSLIGGHPFAEIDLAELSRAHREGTLPPITDYRDDLCPNFVEWIAKLTESDVRKRFSGASEALHSMPKLTPKNERNAVHSSAPKLIVPKLPNKVIHTSKVETLPVFIPKKQSPVKLVVTLSSIAVVLIITAVALLSEDKSNNTPDLASTAPNLEEKQTQNLRESPKPLIELASVIPTINPNKIVRYSSPPGQPVSKPNLNITNNLCDDWIVYMGESLTKQTASHPNGDIIQATTDIGSFQHFPHPLKVLKFHQAGVKHTKTPALNANSKSCDLDPGEGWKVALVAPSDQPNPRLQVHSHFTTWNCDAVVTLKNQDGETLGKPRIYSSNHENTSFGTIDNISKLSPGETIYLEITASEPKSGEDIGLSLNALKVKVLKN